MTKFIIIFSIQKLAQLIGLNPIKIFICDIGSKVIFGVLVEYTYTIQKITKLYAIQQILKFNLLLLLLFYSSIFVRFI